MVCLNEECGLIEWVYNTAGFRVLMRKAYAAKGHPPAMRTTKECRRQYETMRAAVLNVALIMWLSLSTRHHHVSCSGGSWG